MSESHEANPPSSAPSSAPSSDQGGRCYEDFHVGLVMRHPLGRTVSEVDNTWFTLLTANTNPIHFDKHYSAQTEFGQPLMNSTFTLALVVGLSVSDISRNAVNLGWDEVRLPAPVVAGGKVTLTGTAAPGAAVELVTNDEVLGEATADADGLWIVAVQLDPGSYGVRIRTVNSADKSVAYSSR
jgi:acyl dehydratase